MLTKPDLALIRAALKFFDEEMRPFDAKLVRHYFEKPIDQIDDRFDVQELRAALKTCDVRYLSCNPTGLMVLDRRLYHSPHAAAAGIQLARHRLGAALLFKNSLPRRG